MGLVVLVTAATVLACVGALLTIHVARQLSVGANLDAGLAAMGSLIGLAAAGLSVAAAKGTQKESRHNLTMIAICLLVLGALSLAIVRP